MRSAARESVSVAGRVKGKGGANFRWRYSCRRQWSKAKRRSGWALWGPGGGLHLLNESRQRRGVPWPTGGRRSAQHCRRLHHYRGFQGMWCWCGGRHLPRSRGPWWVFGKHCRNLLIQFGRKVFWSIWFSSSDRMVTECWCGYLNISAQPLCLLPLCNNLKTCLGIWRSTDTLIPMLKLIDRSTSCAIKIKCFY